MWRVAIGCAAFSLVFVAAQASAAPAAVSLGTAASFSVLAGAGITNTGATTIAGDIGSYATTSEVGLGTVTLLGVDHAGDAVTQQAKIDLTTAYDQAAASGPPTSVAAELGGTVLTPGVYRGATLEITGTLTLDTQGDPDAVFVFQTASSLVTASASRVVVLGGQTTCNVFWQVASSATLGTGSHLVGTVMASTSITANNGATIDGRLLAQTGAVTLDHNTIDNPVCAAATPTTTTGGSGVGAPTSTAAVGDTTDGGSPDGTTSSSPGFGTPREGGPSELAFTGNRSGQLALVGGLLGAGTLTLIASSRRVRRASWRA